jgi:hypothetical protein
MKLTFAIFMFSVCSAQAAQVVLVCNGSLNFPDNAPMTINGDSAMIDFDAGTFKPPIYSPYQITKVTDTDVNFGLETSTTSIFGTIDRISGNLSMNVMKPEDRKRIMAGHSAKMLAWMSAKCVPAKRMF